MGSSISSIDNDLGIGTKTITTAKRVWRWNGNSYVGLTVNTSNPFSKTCKGPIKGIVFSKLIQDNDETGFTEVPYCFKPNMKHLERVGNFKWNWHSWKYDHHAVCHDDWSDWGKKKCHWTNKTGFKTHFQVTGNKDFENHFGSKGSFGINNVKGNGTGHKVWDAKAGGMSKNKATYIFGVNGLNTLSQKKHFRKHCPFLVFPRSSCKGNNPIECQATCYKSTLQTDADSLYSLKNKAIQNLAQKNKRLKKIHNIPYQGVLGGVKASSVSIMDQRVTTDNVNDDMFYAMIGNQRVNGQWLPVLDNDETPTKVAYTVKHFNGLRCVNKPSSANQYNEFKVNKKCTQGTWLGFPISSTSCRSSLVEDTKKNPLLFDTSFHSVKCSLDFNSDYVRNSLGASGVNSSNFQGYKVFYNKDTKDVIPYFMAATDSSQSKKLFNDISSWVLLQRVNNKDHLLKDVTYMKQCKKLGSGSSGYQTYACPLKRKR